MAFGDGGRGRGGGRGGRDGGRGRGGGRDGGRGELLSTQNENMLHWCCLTQSLPKWLMPTFTLNMQHCIIIQQQAAASAP
jgi:hypothetical protein